MGRGAATDSRTQLGPFWLWYRQERDEWCICWYDEGGAGRGRRTRRKATGIRGGRSDKPPRAAQDALADHYAAFREPEQQPISEAHVEGLMADWLTEHVAKNNADPVRAANCVAHWLQFFDAERKAGRLTGAPVVSNINRSLVDRFIETRLAAGRRGATISRELAALRASLKWAWQRERIASAPFIPDIDQSKKSGPKELVYTPEQVARLLEAAYRLPERRHVHLFIMIMLSTHGRGDAILELHSDQIRDGLIYFNPVGRAQTKKRRSVVPIAPTLAPWLADADGKVIRYRALIAESKWADPDVPEYFERDCHSIKTAFEACLIEAGICEQAVDENGKPAFLPPRQKLGESQPRPHMIGIGSPNTLRHTCSTELHTLGVPDAQIDTAAGHVGTGTNKKNYRHLRPDYLSDFIKGVEAYWEKVGKHTRAHLRSQCDPKIVSFAPRRKVAG